MNRGVAAAEEETGHLRLLQNIGGKIGDGVSGEFSDVITAHTLLRAGLDRLVQLRAIIRSGGDKGKISAAFERFHSARDVLAAVAAADDIGDVHCLNQKPLFFGKVDLIARDLADAGDHSEGGVGGVLVREDVVCHGGRADPQDLFGDSPRRIDDGAHILIGLAVTGPESCRGEIDLTGADLIEGQFSDRLVKSAAQDLGNVVLQDGFARVTGEFGKGDAYTVQFVDAVFRGAAEGGQRRHEDDEIGAKDALGLKNLLGDIAAQRGVDLLDHAVKSREIQTIEQPCRFLLRLRPGHVAAFGVEDV